jgi:energy-coupling factor transporter ATP-binding protein EcfA2
MWLQAIWFLTYTTPNDVVILDEPDVYMHADLQRRLIRLVRGRYNQIIIATHSTEILAEVEPDQVLVVDRRKKKSTFTTTRPAVQHVIHRIGSAHNIHLARLWSSRKFLMVEGKDIGLLKRIQRTLFPESTSPFDAIPNTAIGGWSGWKYVIGSKLFMKNAGGDEIITYCILDSDYYTREQIDARLAEAHEHNIELHIWSGKEIENYLIVPTAIERIMLSHLKKSSDGLLIDEINERISQITAELHDEPLMRLLRISLPRTELWA